MLTKFTPAELQARVEAATPPMVVMDRRNPATAADLVGGVRDVVARTLNSDVDAPFRLVSSLVAEQLMLCQRMREDLAEMRRMVGSARAQPPTVRSRIPELLDVLNGAEVGAVEDLPRHLRKFDRTVRAYAAASKDESGASTVGVDPSWALSQAVVLCGRLLTDLPRVVRNNQRLIELRAAYTAYDCTSPTTARYITYAKRVLEAHVGRDASNQSDAILDSVVASSLLQFSVERHDPFTPKYAGRPAISYVVGSLRRVATLDADQPAWATIRVGDAVYAGEAGATALVGWVTWVDGGSVVFTALQSALPSSTINMGGAVRDVAIVSRGLHHHTLIVPVLATAQTALTALQDEAARMDRAVRTYAESGSQAGAYGTLVTSLDQLLELVASTINTYRAGAVRVVDKLLAHLESERVTLVVLALRSLDFEMVDGLDGLLSEQADVASMMERLQDESASSVPTDQFYQDESQLRDYTRVGG